MARIATTAAAGVLLACAARSEIGGTIETDAASDAAPESAAVQCGGFAGKPCPSSFVCVFGPHACQSADEFGECISSNCASTQCAYVCGCDGKTYCNECVAATAGVVIDHEGQCP